MIDLTPLDVRKKKEDFKRAVRGYDAEQVDTFLDLVADRLEDLVREHRSLSERVETMEQQLITYRERESALNEALLAAQELREEARSQAARDAAVRLREAETHAEAILLDADQAIRHSQRRLEDLQARRTQFIRSLRGVLERFSDYLDLEGTRLESEPDDLTVLLEKLEADLPRIPEPSEASGGSRPTVGESDEASGRIAEPGETGSVETAPVSDDGSGPATFSDEDAPEPGDSTPASGAHTNGVDSAAEKDDQQPSGSSASEPGSRLDAADAEALSSRPESDGS